MPIRLLGRKKVMTCMGCLRDKSWPDAFINGTYAECLTCWLRKQSSKRREFFRRALFELEQEERPPMNQGDWP